jgi:hypothetical protein
MARRKGGKQATRKRSLKVNGDAFRPAPDDLTFINRFGDEPHLVIVGGERPAFDEKEIERRRNIIRQLQPSTQS